jgi:hypothetical protein
VLSETEEGKVFEEWLGEASIFGFDQDWVRKHVSQNRLTSLFHSPNKTSIE